MTLYTRHKRYQVFQMLGWRTFVLLDHFQCRLFNVCKYSWCNTETVFRAWPRISEHNQCICCVQSENSSTRQLLGTRATHTARVCPVTLSSKGTFVKQRCSQSTWLFGHASVHLICVSMLNPRYHKASKFTLGAHIKMHPILKPRHSN